jgi:hypothetical protein
MADKSIKTFLWRGALGGIVGGLIWIFVIPILHSGSVLNSYYLGLALFAGIPLTLAVGSIVGAIIWVIYVNAERNINAVERALIGTVIALLAGAVYSVMTNESRHNPSYLMYLVEFAMIVGVSAGITIGNQNQKEQGES